MLIMLETIVVNTIYLLFPLTIYFIYLAYIRNMDLEEKSIFLEFSIFSSIYLIIRYGMSYDYVISLMLLNIPLLVCYFKRKNVSALIISLICIMYCHEMLKIPVNLLILEYSSYFILYLLPLKKKKKPMTILRSVTLSKAFFLAIEINLYLQPEMNTWQNIFYLLLLLLIFIFISEIILWFLYKGEEIMDLNATLNELEKEKRVRSSLFKITHEIKNPIAVCKGYLDMMDGKDKKTIERYTKIMKEEIGRTLLLMDDFLSCTKVKIEKEEVDLYLLLEEINDSLLPLCRKNKVKIIIPENVDEELYIMLDYNRMKQVLINLIKNAMEAKKEDQEETIEIIVEETKEKVQMTIKDDGIGMSSETLQKVAELFYTTKEKGTGLGVSLSKEIIELHGGNIRYFSTLGKGTSVKIELPLEISS